MIGYAVSPLVFAPLSEVAGRRLVLIGSYTCYALFTLCCALAPTYTTLLVFRLLAGVSAAVPNTVVGGLFADVFDGPRARGEAVAWFMFTAGQGPLVGPLVSGFVSANLGWRWTFWIGLIIAGIGLPFVWALPETYVPVLAQKRTEEKKSELTKTARAKDHLRVVGDMLMRPGLMMVKEPILLSTSLYLALVYAMLYLFFQAYPIVFGGVYGLSQDIVGLAYIPSMHSLARSLYYSVGLLLILDSHGRRDNTEAPGATIHPAQPSTRTPKAAA
jgi:multidrug resistance protein